jgi:hypothetical protein
MPPPASTSIVGGQFSMFFTGAVALDQERLRLGRL